MHSTYDFNLFDEYKMYFNTKISLLSTVISGSPTDIPQLQIQADKTLRVETLTSPSTAANKRGNMKRTTRLRRVAPRAVNGAGREDEIGYTTVVLTDEHRCVSVMDP